MRDSAVRPIRLDLDQFAPPRTRHAVGVLVLVLSLVTAVALVLRYRDLTLELNRMQAAQAIAGAERRPAREIPKARLDEEARTAELVRRQLALPWPEIVRTVEESAMSDVAVLQLQPDALRHELRLTAEARNQDMMLEFLRRLAMAKVLRDVHVVRHQVQMDNPERPVNFSILAVIGEKP